MSSVFPICWSSPSSRPPLQLSWEAGRSRINTDPSPCIPIPMNDYYRLDTLGIYSPLTSNHHKTLPLSSMKVKVFVPKQAIFDSAKFVWTIDSAHLACVFITGCLSIVNRHMSWQRNLETYLGIPVIPYANTTVWVSPDEVT